MQTASHALPIPSGAQANPFAQSDALPALGVLAHYQIIRRNGSVVAFEPHKIAVAMMKAFLAVR